MPAPVGQLASTGKELMRRIGFSQPKRGFGLFIFYFSFLPFQIPFEFKFNSNFCGSSLQIIFVILEVLILWIVIYILFIIHLLYLFLISKP
jgi:hypothetical protein